MRVKHVAWAGQSHLLTRPVNLDSPGVAPRRNRAGAARADDPDHYGSGPQQISYLLGEAGLILSGVGVLSATPTQACSWEPIP